MNLQFGLACLLTMVAGVSAVAEERVAANKTAFFEAKVRPLLARHCLECHGANRQEGGLRLDSLTAMKKGGESEESAVVVGMPTDSLLMSAIRYESYEMPPNKQLSDEQIAIMEKWIADGATWPGGADAHIVRRDEDRLTDEDRQWWAVQPLADVSIPNSGDDWARNEIDRFLARKLDDAGLTPSREADRYELVRRAYFDLHGLPPTAQQVEAFVSDDRPDAWPRLIKQLLDSPRYGERWAQHWLDVVRYAESDGYREDAFRPAASVFRDYVINSFNEDKPYDQLVREHLAGDEIAPDDPNVFIGTAYLRHGVYEWNQRNARMHWDLIVNEMTRVTGEAFLGISVGCAQCHDHKFDPILQKDYFGLQAFLSSVAWPMDRPLANAEQITEHDEKLRAWEQATAAIRDEMDALTKDAFDRKQKSTVGQFPDDIQAIYRKPESQKTTYEKQLSYLVDRQAKRAAKKFDYAGALKKHPEKLARYKELQEELKRFDASKPKPLPTAFVATDVGTEPAPTYLLTRTTKEAIEPSFLTLLGQKPSISPTATSTGRRTALADWIASESNPLSTRVIVNRVWQRHFGTGIVPTPNDLGTLGEAPSHPELLDWLTREFLKDGWKFKALHERIMNSATYRQTTRREPTEAESNVDPTNRLLWRFPPQRLDAEQVRDAMLAISGELKPRDGGASVGGTSPYRSVYVKKLRNKPDEMLCGFDAPMGFESAPDRVATTTPIQSLLMVNGSWTLNRSQALAKRLLAGKQSLSPDNIRTAYQLVFNRHATDEEVAAAQAFLKSQAQTIAAPKTSPKYPNETGFRPVTQHFKNVKDAGLSSRTLWIQPGSRFERLQLSQGDDLENEFTVEAITILDRVYSDASVNTLLSRWNGSTKTNGWNIGVTSRKSAYDPQNFIVQLVGHTFQDEPEYQVVASGLTFPLNKPVYMAAVISANPSGENPTAGSVTFYLKDLSAPDAPLQHARVETSVVGGIRNPAAKMILGGRNSRGHLWDGQVARLKISRGLLSRDQLLIAEKPDEVSKVVDLIPRDDSSLNNATWMAASEPKKASAATSKALAVVTDFCHALFNSNEFLYLH